MRFAKVILAILVFAALWIPGSAKADDFTPDERAALDRGEIVRKPLDPAPDPRGYLGGTSYVVVNATPEVVWTAMQDVSAYPSIFPRTLGAEVISDRGNRRVIKMIQGTSWISISSYVLFRIDAEARKISWSLIEDQPHDLQDTRGYWQVQAWGEGKSLLTYVNVVNLGPGTTAVLALFIDPIQNGLLGVPGNLRDWVQAPTGDRYRESATAAGP